MDEEKEPVAVTNKKTVFSMLWDNEFCISMRESQLFRFKVLYTISLYAVFFCMGWGRGQLGPSFADLQLITNVDLEKGSWIITSFFIGCTVGSPIGGMLHDFMDRKLLFTISHLIMAGTFFVIPWCSVFELMAFVYFIQGLFEGIVNPVGNAELIGLWTKHGKAIFLALTVVFCLGGIISPSITAPFLLEKLNDTSKVNESISNAALPSVALSPFNYSHATNNESIEQYLATINGTIKTITSSSPMETSRLYIAFSISGCLFLLISVLCFATYVLDKKLQADLDTVRKSEADLELPTLSQRYKWSMLAIFSTFLFFEVGMDEVFATYISLFCVKQLGWSKVDAAHVLSVAFISAIVSGVCGVFLIKCISTKMLTGLCLLLALIAVLGLTLFSVYHIDVGVWISVPLTSFAKGNVFGLIFTWTNEFITPLTGKISSLYMVVSMVGSSVLPILNGYLMEEVTLVSFCYIFLSQSVIMIVIFIFAVMLTRVIVKEYGTVLERTEKVSKEVKQTSKKLLSENDI